MSNFIPVDTPGGTILIEVDEGVTNGKVELTGIQGRKVTSFEELIDVLKKNAHYIIKQLEDICPDEMEVTFGIKMGAEAGIPFFALAKATGESSYEITVKWKANHKDLSEFQCN